MYTLSTGKTGELPLRGALYLWWILGTAILVFLLVLVFVMPIRTDLFYECVGNDGIIKAKISILGGLFNITLAETKPEEKIKMCLPLVKYWLKRIKNALPTLRPVISYLLSKTVIKSLSWQTKFGLGDAASTGILTGIIWGVKSTLTNWFSARVKRFCHHTQLAVIPVFSAASFSMEVHCIFEVRLGHIIIAGATAIRKIRQQRG